MNGIKWILLKWKYIFVGFFFSFEKKNNKEIKVGYVIHY